MMKSNSSRPFVIELEEGKTYAWCRCGQSSSQPFCDGSHGGSHEKPFIFKATEHKKVFLCGCKSTKSAPFCDGTHLTLASGGQS